MAMTHYRKCIKMTAKDSPNVALALWQIENRLPVTGDTVVPGVISWQAYCKKLATFSDQRKCESLEADWWEGADEFLVAKEWLQFANEFAKRRPTVRKRGGRKWMGVDSGGGGDKSAICVGDEWGVVDLWAEKTQDTNRLYGMILHKARDWDVAWEDVVLDIGGGGQQHADRMRANGMQVRTVSFGTIKKEMKRGMTFFDERRGVEEDQASFDQRRSEMAYDVRTLLERPVVLRPENFDPEVWKTIARDISTKDRQEKPGYALPLPMCEELCRQLSLIPMRWDDRGRFRLIPKSNPRGDEEGEVDTLKKRIGRSPDEFDALCCMAWGMKHQPTRTRVGVN